MSLTDFKHTGRIICYKVFLNLVLDSDTALSSTGYSVEKNVSEHSSNIKTEWLLQHEF